ncbi:MAG: sugar transferase [Flavobacterium sp.]|nr:sugar transferase [Flavobacterium sp.]
MVLIRLADLLASFIAAIILSPFFLIIAIVIKLNSKGPVFYRQVRVGKDGKDFRVYKFRSMFTDADKKGLLTVGGNDSRITSVGLFLRKYKLDELPQVFNVLKGEMSVVGPRPEVRKYVDLYNDEQRKVLSVLPGITDYASIEFKNENELLAKATNPEQFYIDEIMPEKIKLNARYIDNKSIFQYIKIVFLTIIGIFKKG